MKRLICSILIIILAGCHVSDIPFIGWRIDVARQREAQRKWDNKSPEEQDRIIQRFLQQMELEEAKQSS